jgi:hypothetical protein
MKAMLDPMMVAARTHFRAAKEHTDVAAADWIMASSQGDFTLAIDASDLRLDDVIPFLLLRQPGDSLGGPNAGWVLASEFLGDFG